MINDLLDELGFSDYEKKIYLELVNLGSALAGTIAEKAKVNRRNVYDALNRLIKKGFVSSVVKNKKKYYTPINPKNILSSYQEKVDLFKNVLPEIMGKYNANQNKQEVHVFESIGGMKSVFKIMLEEKKNVFVIGSTGLALEKMPIFMTQIFKKKLQNIKIKQLHNYDALNIKEYQELLGAESRILPKNFKTATQIFLCGDKSFIIIWSIVPIAILIVNKEIREGFKKYFDFLWKISE